LRVRCIRAGLNGASNEEPETIMKDAFPRGKTAIVGAATFGLGESPGFSNMDLAAHASLRALVQAGIQPKAVDGLFVVTMDDTMSGLTLAEYLGIEPRLTDNARTGGSSFEIHASIAALALAAGQCDVALIAYGSNQRSAAGKHVSSSRASPWEAPYKPMNPVSSYALAASRHMHQYGTTREQLGEVAIAARRWAQRNPQAFMRDSLSLDDYLKARMVSDPLGLRDCCLVTDGAAAVVMVRADRARDLCARPAYLLGAAAETTHREIASMPDLTVTGTAKAAQRAFAQAGVTPRDIDVVELYDAFTINTILFLEDMGFCPKGEGGRFVEGGRIAPGGDLPVNTNGGGLSCTHPGMYGLFTMVEAAQQIQGACAERQVAGAELAVAHGNGGVLSSEAVLVLGSAEAL
jgi:acetyl-CoA acetyltransferase